MYDPSDDARRSYDVAIAAKREALDACERVQIGDATLYCGDCRVILPTLGNVDAAIVSDPQYGIGHSGNSQRFSGGQTRRGPGSNHGPIHGDDKPFDPTFLLGFGEVVLWGANNFLDRLPSGTLLVWLKRNDEAFGTFLGDGEVAWKRGGRGIYAMRHVYAGSRAAMEYCADAYATSAHPHQKPIAVMEWCLDFVKGQTILDPFMGSGTTGVACAKLGRRFIGIEIERRYFDIACRRIEEAYAQPDLFIEPPAPAPEQIGMEGL